MEKEKKNFKAPEVKVVEIRLNHAFASRVFGGVDSDDSDDSAPNAVFDSNCGE